MPYSSTEDRTIGRQSSCRGRWERPAALLRAHPANWQRQTGVPQGNQEAISLRITPAGGWIGLLPTPSPALRRPQRAIRHYPQSSQHPFCSKSTSAQEHREGGHMWAQGSCCPAPGTADPEGKLRFPCRRGQHLLCRASALLCDDARQQLGLGPCRLHILSVLFSNLWKGGGNSELAVQKQGVPNRPPSVV